MTNQNNPASVAGDSSVPSDEVKPFESWYTNYYGAAYVDWNSPGISECFDIWSAAYRASAAQQPAERAQGGLTDEQILAALASITHEVPTRLPPGWMKFARAIERAILARQPQGSVAVGDALDDQTIRERDYNADMADKLAAGIAEHFGRDIGEHSSANCPWTNALELLDTKPEFAPCAGSIAAPQSPASGMDMPEAGNLPPVPKPHCLVVGVYGYLQSHMSDYGKACFSAGQDSAQDGGKA